MRRVIAIAAVCLFVSSGSAQAIPPFSEGFKEMYVMPKPDGPLVAKVATAKCNVCHDANSKSKKDRNEYGNAVSKHLKKADFVGATKKFDPKSPEGKKAIADGLKAAGAEKSSKGDTFEAILSSDNLP